MMKLLLAVCAASLLQLLGELGGSMGPEAPTLSVEYSKRVQLGSSSASSASSFANQIVPTSGSDSRELSNILSPVPSASLSSLSGESGFFSGFFMGVSAQNYPGGNPLYNLNPSDPCFHERDPNVGAQVEL